MPGLLKGLSQGLLTYMRQHLFRAIVGAIASTIVAAGSIVVVPPTTVEKNGWVAEIRQHFGRVVSNRLLVKETIAVPSGTVDLYWDESLAPTLANLKRAVLLTTHGVREDFFFMDGDLEFVYRSASDATTAEQASETAGDRYYFRRGARVRLPFSRQWMFHWVAADQREIPHDQREFRVSERVVLNDAKNILRIARTSPHLVSNPLSPQ